MPKRRILLFLLWLLLILGLAATPAYAGEPSQLGAPDAPDAVDKSVDQPGFYIIGVSVDLDPNRYPIAGDLFYIHWSNIQTGINQYYWPYIDRILALHSANGKKIALAFTTYEGYRTSVANGGGISPMPPSVRKDGPLGDDSATIITFSDGWQVPR